MEPVDRCPVITLLSRSEVLYNIPGEDKIDILSAIVERLTLPDGVDRDRVIEEVLRRENIASTAIGQGIAIPHPQSAASLQMPESVLALAFLEHPVDFGAPDDLPVQAIFIILSRDPGQHLRLLAHLSRILQKAEVIDALARQLPATEILAVLRRVETDLHDRYAATAAR